MATAQKISLIVMNSLGVHLNDLLGAFLRA